MLTSSEKKYLKVMAELQLRGLPHGHRQAAALCGWSSTHASWLPFHSLVEKGFITKVNEERVKVHGCAVVIDAGPKLTDKAWEFLSQRKAA